MYDVKINVGTIGADNNTVYPLSGFAAAFATLALKMATSTANTNVTRVTLQSEMEDKMEQINDKLYALTPTPNVIDQSGVVEDIALQTMIRELHTQLLKSSDAEVARLGVEFYRLIE